MKKYFAFYLNLFNRHSLKKPFQIVFLKSVAFEGGSKSREFILNKMRQASSNPTGNDPNFGYGWINTAEALQ